MNIDYKNKSGIYLIKCLASMKFYIGSAKSVYSRLHCHFDMLRRNDHYNIHLQRSFNKHGERSFVWGVVEFTGLSEMIEREQHFIDSLKPQMNIAPLAQNTLGLKIKFTPERQRQISEMRRVQATNNNPMKGKKHKQETKSLISQKQKAAIKRRGGLHPNFYNASIAANTGRKHSEKEINDRVQAQRKLSDKQAAEIRKKLGRGAYQKDLAKEYGVSQRLIVRVKFGIGVYGK